MKKKLICGYLHYQLPCWCCGELIWTQHEIGNVCNQCINEAGYGIGRETSAGYHDVPYSEYSYNGSVHN